MTDRIPMPQTIAIMNETVGIGGAESLILHMAVELRDRGHRVICVLPLKDDWLTNALDAESIPIRRFHLSRAIDAKCARDLTQTLRDEGVDAIHSHEFAMAVYGTVVAHRLRCPHVISLHGNQRMLDKLQRRLALRWAVRNSTATVAVSTSTRTHLLDRLRLGVDDITVIRNGVPATRGSRNTTRAALGLSPDQVVLFAAGSLVERKGFHLLIEALGRLKERDALSPKVHLFIAGEGSYRPTIEGAIREHAMEAHATLLGYRLDIADLQAAADLFVMPSLWEGLPLAVLEGMFAGNPIVATRTSGIPEAITHGVEGLLVEPGDVEGLAGALERVLGDPDLRAELGARALARAHADFTIERMTDDYLALYRAG
jgi:glycosyltransferase involved in cell wall biosynthesis